MLNIITSCAQIYYNYYYLSYYLFFILIFKEIVFYLFIYFLREREIAQAWGGGVEGEGEREF